MRVLILCQYFVPEEVGIGVQLLQLASDLIAKGHQVTVLTAFPNYPKRVVFNGYKGKLFQKETIDGIEVIRTWIYASPRESVVSRLLNWGSFCLSSFFGGLVAKKPDVIYAVLPPLPLGVTAVILGKVKRARVVSNVQDIYPLIAIELGILRNKHLIRFFEAMERWVYRASRRVVVISDGFKENLCSKGVDSEKVAVVSNWADAGAIQPGPRQNSFRRELGVNGDFTLVYSGSLSRNSNMEPVVKAADLLRDEAFAFAVVGEGAMKPELQAMAEEMKLSRLQFKPFQPLERYPEVLASGDMCLVTLNSKAALASVPSKVFKQMAAGRAILAITSKGNELDRLLSTFKCGICVPPDDPGALAEALRWASQHPQELEEMGRNARRCLEEHYDRTTCVSQLEAVLADAACKSRG